MMCPHPHASHTQCCERPAALVTTTTDSSGALHVLPTPTNSSNPPTSNAPRPSTSASSEASKAPPSSSRNPTPTPSSSSRSRFTWTPELHAHFVNAVYHLGLDNAMPKSILALMNVPGMTREHVASHLQKYRQQLKRQQQQQQEEGGDDQAMPPSSGAFTTPITTKELCYPVDIPLSLVLNPLSFANYGPMVNNHAQVNHNTLPTTSRALAHHPSLVLPPSLPDDLVARRDGYPSNKSSF